MLSVMKHGTRTAMIAIAAAAILAARCGPAKTTKGAEEPAAQIQEPGDKPAQAQEEAGVKVEGNVTCAPVVEGRPCGFSVTVRNDTDDIVIVSSLETDRAADGGGELLADEYGSLHEDELGNVQFNQLAQMATPRVFFGRDLLMLPGETTVLEAETRFFGDARNVTVRYYRFPASQAGRHIFINPMQAQPTGGLMGAAANVVFVPLPTLEKADKVQGRFIFWNGQDLEAHELAVALDPTVKEAAFGMKKARAKIKGKPEIEETSYCDTFSAWIFNEAGATWLVRESGAEKLGHVYLSVFEAIDEKAGKDVRFKVPETVFAKTYKLEDGDGMYTQGKFLTASGDGILDVLRMLEPAGLSCRVTYYFFTSWYLEIE
jgi:hypothetical protein